ncbi:S41 family peptidase [Polaribacter sp.]|uniref:S41 family peptidase n=1 Tax=Polaribacter sp. TaxID=1920175 RepID=UPI003EF86E7D
MTKILQFSFLALLLVFGSACSSEDNVNSIEPTTDDDINYFIWKGMNAYYLWQQDVPDLADDRFKTYDELYTHFRTFSSPKNVFESVLYTPADRFSWIVDDYIALENAFQGISTSNGMEFGLVRYQNNPDNIYGYVRYVIPNSDAAAKGLKRGMLFNSVNGTLLTESNYLSLLFGDSNTYSLGFAAYNDGNPTANNTSVSLVKTELQENPIAVSKVITAGKKRIGYLMYNQFASSYDDQLNAVFNLFNSPKVDELIIDLRYNGGGSVRTATYLGSMVTGQFNGQLYSKLDWNEKVIKNSEPSDLINNFTNQINNGAIKETINSLGLSKVYFIVSGSSASASELVINALSSYIDVRLVGVTTVGKQVGSITLYDSENLKRNGNDLNPNHSYALQPLVLEITNKDGQNKPEGFTPGTTLPGIEQKENYGNLGVLGELSDPLLETTITYILSGAKPYNRANSLDFKEVFNSKLAMPTSNNMYVDLK